VFSRAELVDRLRGAADVAEALAARADEIAARLARPRRSLHEQLEVTMDELESLVRAFNDACGRERRAAAAKLRHALARERAWRRALVRVERPIAALGCATARLLAAARASLADAR